jgi:hypothetical protein
MSLDHFACREDVAEDGTLEICEWVLTMAGVATNNKCPKHANQS